MAHTSVHVGSVKEDRDECVVTAELVGITHPGVIETLRGRRKAGYVGESDVRRGIRSVELAVWEQDPDIVLEPALRILFLMSAIRTSGLARRK